MAAWTLTAHGDELERKWGSVVSERAPLYETFWIRHVVPLTYRMADPECRDPNAIMLRSEVRRELAELALKSHRIFTHLAECHRQLATGADFFTPRAIYDFYSRLYSIGESVEEFLAAVRVVLRKYNGVSFGGDRQAERLKAHGAPGLDERYEEAFEKRSKDYRGKQVHSKGFPFIENRMPRREHLARWIGKGHAEVNAFLSAPDLESRVEAEFVDARQQASEDLDFVERVANEVWELALRELDGIKDIEGYRADQAAGADSLPQQNAVASQSISFGFRRIT